VVSFLGAQLNLSFCFSYVFRDVSKVFNQIWNKGLIHKLEWHWCHRGPGKLVQGLHHKKKTNGDGTKATSWKVTDAGVPQEFTLGPLLFMSYNEVTVFMVVVCVYIGRLWETIRIQPSMVGTGHLMSSGRNR
jgi:hypothetical protein